MSDSPSFPPLLSGERVGGNTDPFEKARAMAALGCDGGTVVYNPQLDQMRCAMVFAPEVPLEQAMTMLPVCGVGFQNALGALAPPEVAVHLGWDGEIFVNGAGCGAMRIAASDPSPDAVPDWLVIGIEVPFLWADQAPGHNPGVTVLAEEGCGDLSPLHLLEAWARHTLVWINRWADAGAEPVHAEWLGLVRGVGDPVTRGGHSGRFLGVDDRFGMLIRDADTTHLIPMSTPTAGEPMNLARAIHFDESDMNVFHSPARTGEWCISGGFEFSNWSEADLAGKARQAFANGWLGAETFGRVTFAAVTPVQPAELQALEQGLAQHFVRLYGAPSVEAALGVAADEINHMVELCSDHDMNTLLTVARELTPGGVREAFRVIEADDADLEQLAVHFNPDA